MCVGQDKEMIAATVNPRSHIVCQQTCSDGGPLKATMYIIALHFFLLGLHSRVLNSFAPYSPLLHDAI